MLYRCLLISLIATATRAGSVSEAPFALPFGPDNGDSFTTKSDDACSREQNLTRSFRFGNHTFDSLYICTNGYISFQATQTFYDPVQFVSATYPLLGAFVSDIQTYDNLFDSGCFEINYNNYNYPFEHVCSAYLSFQLAGNNYAFYQTLANINYILDDDLRDQVYEWTRTSINVSDIEVTFDDDITRKLMGENTIDVNLGNNIFKREVTSHTDLDIITGLVSPFSPTFVANFSYVATWYKVGPYPRRIDGFNSFQTIIACDALENNVYENVECYTIFDYFEIGWTDNAIATSLSAIAGFNDADGNIYEMPFSGTWEMRNVWARTNTGIPGLFIFKLGQTRNPDLFVQSVGEFDSIDSAPIECPGEVFPVIFPTATNNTSFTLPHCYLPQFETLAIVFETGEGSLFATEVLYSNQTAIVTGNAPFVYSAELDIQMYVVLDGVRLVLPDKVISYARSAETKELEINMVIANGIVTIDVTNIPHNLGFGSFFQILLVSIDLTQSFVDFAYTAGTSSQQLTVEAGSAMFVCIVIVDLTYAQPSRAQSVGLRVDETLSEPEASAKCLEWDAIESGKDYSNCVSGLERWYGCPHQLSSNRVDVSATDAEWAHEEVLNGIVGWQYDMCCSNNTDLRTRLANASYCDKEQCQFNPGADFCIRSPRLACIEKNSEKIIYTSNQCCYEAGTGNLIRGGTSLAPGSMDRQLNSLPTMVAHYIADLEPFKHCCLESNNCDLYKTHRPTVIGRYFPRNILFGRGDPDFQTVDGLSYPFNGIGVFTLLKTTSDQPTTVEVSTRRVGEGSVVSGVAIKYNTSLLQLYISNSSNVSLVINDNKIDLDQYDNYKVGLFEIEQKENKNVFKIELDGVGLFVQVIVTNNFFNLMTSVPPTFKHKMKGLMGYYDGNTANDYTKPDGTIVDVSVNFTTLHDQFGEAWRVASNDWLFEYSYISNQILQDISLGSVGFVPRYEIVFGSESERLQAVQQCNNDTACMRDISLTNDFSFATVFQALEEQVENADRMTELYRENEPVFADDDLQEPEKSGSMKLFMNYIVLAWIQLSVVCSNLI